MAEVVLDQITIKIRMLYTYMCVLSELVDSFLIVRAFETIIYENSSTSSIKAGHELNCQMTQLVQALKGLLARVDEHPIEIRQYCM